MTTKRAIKQLGLMVALLIAVLTLPVAMAWAIVTRNDPVFWTIESLFGVLLVILAWSLAGQLIERRNCHAQTTPHRWGVKLKETSDKRTKL